MVNDSQLAFYVHWPFCVSKCPYCDFNSHVVSSLNEEEFVEHYLSEIAYWHQQIPDRTISSIYFGGGTPSLMNASSVEKILSAIQNRWRLSNDVEITLEANPVTAEIQKFRDFQMAGVNRLSVGIQALNAADLNFLGRAHSAEEGLRALEMAHSVFERFSFDLIYARPNQTLLSWQSELQQALEFAKGHLSLYQLTIEKGTPFFAAYRAGEFVLPEEELAADMYELTAEVVGQHGMQAYEISNYAAPSQESQHNLAYWRYHEYVGVGPGAHGRVKLGDEYVATVMEHQPQKWAQKVQECGVGKQKFVSLEPDIIAQEMIMMGLRVAEGLNATSVLAKTGQPLESWLEPDYLQRYLQAGLLNWRGDHLQASERGRMVLSRLTSDLIRHYS